MTLFSNLIRQQIRRPIREQHAFPGKITGRVMVTREGVNYPDMVTPLFDKQMPTPPTVACVIKPVDGSNSQGVLPLIPIGDGHWQHIWTLETRLWSGWIGPLHNARGLSHATNGPFYGPWYAERMVMPITDWKFYCLHGAPVWVRQHHKTGPRGHECDIKCYRVAHGEVIPLEYDVLIQNKRLNLGLPPLRRPERMIAAVTRLAQLWQRTFGDVFIRVDMFEGSVPLFGEFTPQPAGGKQVYQREWDMSLGEIWLDH